MASTSSQKFEKADSRNLPKVENVMILEYLAENDKYNKAEIRGAKMLMSSRDSYVNNAVGYVQVSRINDQCTIMAKIVPEHRVTNKLYNCQVHIDEGKNVIIDSTCEDCAAAAGGCKHSLLLLFWLEKKSVEPSPTAIECYWRKPTLSGVRNNVVRSKDIFMVSKKPRLDAKDPNVLRSFLEECERRGTSNTLIQSFHSDCNDSVNLFDIALQFVHNERVHDFDHFMQYASKKISEDVVKKINAQTLSQSESKLWYFVRQARLTASKLHEAANCNTDGALVQYILGGYKVPETKAIQRGKKLEKEIIKEIQRKLKIKIEPCGFTLINPILGASPDGVSGDFIVEIKCPISKKSLANYVKDNLIAEKHRTQMYCQMLALKKNRGLFCVADPSFEDTKIIHTYWVSYDELFLTDIITRATGFWRKYVFPKIINSALK